MLATCGMNYARNSFQIFVRRDDYVLTPEGEWTYCFPGTEALPSFEWREPVATEIIKAVAEWHRDRSDDPATEAKVLREILSVERDRVDKLIDRCLP